MCKTVKLSCVICTLYFDMYDRMLVLYIHSACSLSNKKVLIIKGKFVISLIHVVCVSVPEFCVYPLI